MFMHRRQPRRQPVLSCHRVAGTIALPPFEFTLRRCLPWAVCLSLAFASSGAAQTGARQVLLLNSFERGSAVENLFAGTLRTELGRQSPQPINFFEVSLQPVLAPEDPENPREGPVVDYLLHAFGQRLDLVVTLGGPAAEFAQKYRERLFPTTPLLLTAMDHRWVEGRTFTTNETALGVVTDPVQIIEDMLRLLPDTTNIFCVIGSSRIEELWRNEVSRRVQPFEDRLTFVWSNELSFEDMLERSATLPPHSAIFYLLLSVDASGASQEEERTLVELHAAANAPMFGLLRFPSRAGHGRRFVALDRGGGAELEQRGPTHPEWRTGGQHQDGPSNAWTTDVRLA